MVHIRQIIFKNFSVAREMAQCLKVLFFTSKHPDRELITTHKSSCQGSIAQL